MKKYVAAISFMVSLCFIVSFSFSFQAAPASEELQKKAAQIFKKNCSVVGCHAGPFPAVNMNLEEGKFEDSLVGKPSYELKDLKLIDVDNPEQSYLLKKIRGEAGIVGKQMPSGSPPLSEEDQKIIEDWVKSFKDSENRKTSGSSQTDLDQKFSKPVFWGTRLVNLPTTHSLGKGQILFRISHRFFPAVKDGYDEFFGLDGPAAMLLGLGYGITSSQYLPGGDFRLKDTEFRIGFNIFRLF